MHSHNHLHRRQRQHDDDDNDNPFEQGLSSIANGINSFFGIGGNNAAPTPTPPSSPAGNSAPPPPSPPQSVGSRRPDKQSDDGNDSNTAAAAAITTEGGGGGGGGSGAAKTVFVTASNTLTGDFTWSTLGLDPKSTSSPLQTSTPKVASTIQSTTTKDDPEPETTSIPTTKRTSPTTSSSKTTALSMTAAASTTLTSIASITPSSSDASSIASTAAATSTPTSLAVTQDTGLSGGAKAGIAIGVILAILALAAGAFALYRMKKRRDEDAFDASNNEKNPFSDKAADQLPVMPTQAPYKPAAPFDARPAGPANPFAVGVSPVDVSGSPTFGSNAEKAAMTGAAAVAAASAGGAVVARRTSVPAPLNLSNRAQSPALVPPPAIAPSPVGSAFSESSTMTAGGMAAAGGAGAGIANGPRMHRVQMDFNPTMEDELQIKAGEIVRCVKEFDDGWCSVEIVQRDAQGTIIRHEQGVVPRTCLSRLPLKPRQKRVGPPIAVQNGPSPLNTSSPLVGRTQSPALANNQAQRSMSPGPYGGGPQDRPRPQDNRNRSNSAGDAQRPNKAAIGLSPMNPAAQTPSSIDLPIQLQSPSLPQLSTTAPAPAAGGHARTASSSSTPVARKPVPKQQHTTNLSQ